MSIKDFIKGWKKVVREANDKGIPLPMARDPNTLEGSVSLTLVVFSSFLVIVGIVGKWSGLIGGIDMNSAFNFFYASTTLYFGHSWVTKDERMSKEKPSSKATIDDPDA